MMDVRNFALCAGEFANVPECSWSRSAIDLNSLWDGVQRGFAIALMCLVSGILWTFPSQADRWEL